MLPQKRPQSVVAIEPRKPDARLVVGGSVEGHEDVEDDSDADAESETDDEEDEEEEEEEEEVENEDLDNDDESSVVTDREEFGVDTDDHSGSHAHYLPRGDTAGGADGPSPKRQKRVTFGGASFRYF